MELMGVYDEALVEPLAQVMAKLGVAKGMVVYGQDKLDEISMSAPTTVCDISDGMVPVLSRSRPEQFGYDSCAKEELTGRDSRGKCTDHQRYSGGQRKRAQATGSTA